MNNDRTVVIPIKLAEEIYNLLLRRVAATNVADWALTEELDKCIIQSGGYTEEQS